VEPDGTSPASPAKLSIMGNLTAYGHSWVAGEAASHESRGFVAVAASDLGLAAMNLGVGGSSSVETAHLLQRTPPPASDLNVVMTGLNDARRYGDSAEALVAYAMAMESIFAALGRATPAARVIAVEQPPLLDYSLYPPHDRGSNDILVAYNDRLRSVASGIPYVVLATVPDWDAPMMLDADTVHPNDLGHAALAAALVAVAEIG